MPFMIGPGTVSAAVVAGARLPFGLAMLSIVTALAATVLSRALDGIASFARSMSGS